MSVEPGLPANAGDGLDELLAKALRPVGVQVIVDPVTLDRLFILHFEDHGPIHIAIGPAELACILNDLSRAVASSLN